MRLELPEKAIKDHSIMLRDGNRQGRVESSITIPARWGFQKARQGWGDNLKF